MSDVILRRYFLPSLPSGEDWAVIVIGSDGFFSAVSDFGNYAFLWRDFGRDDFRKFLIGSTPNYIIGKLSPGKEYDGEQTLQNIRRSILLNRRQALLERHAARRAWDDLEDYGFEHEFEFYRWEFDETNPALTTSVIVAKRHPLMVERFAHETFPRLVSLLGLELRTELAARVSNAAL